MTRMERYKRALKYDLSPPPELLEILELEGINQSSYLDQRYNYL